VPSPSAPAELLADLARACASQRIRWYVFGAQAVLIWGRPRFTADLDVTIEAGRAVSELVAAFRDHGMSLRPEGTDTFIASTRVLPFRHDRSGLAADIVLAGPGLEQVFLERAINIDVAGVAVPFISPEDLIVTKVIAGRAKDLEDIRGILVERAASLQLPYISDTLQAIEQALDRSDLLPMFESLLAESRRIP
jgi:hypothetical protein